MRVSRLGTPRSRETWFSTVEKPKLFGDDGVGIRVVRTLLARLQHGHDLVFKELSVLGIRLIEEILGFDHVIIIDSHTGEDTEPGRIRRFTPSDFTDTFHHGILHGPNFHGTRTL